jgi:hypothetical protein
MAVTHAMAGDFANNAFGSSEPHLQIAARGFGASWFRQRTRHLRALVSVTLSLASALSIAHSASAGSPTQAQLCI